MQGTSTACNTHVPFGTICSTCTHTGKTTICYKNGVYHKFSFYEQEAGRHLPSFITTNVTRPFVYV